MTRPRYGSMAERTAGVEPDTGAWANTGRETDLALLVLRSRRRDPCAERVAVELVLRLNSVAEETVRIEGLRYAALFWEMRALAAEAELARGREHPDADHTIAERWQAWREGSTGLAAGLFLKEEARALLERRYLEGTPTLFPDLAADWLRLCEQAERLAGLGDLVDVTAATVDGARRRRGRAPGRPQIDLHQLRAAALEGAPDEAASLVDAARAAALDTLGDTDGVAAIAERRLRAERGA